MPSGDDNSKRMTTLEKLSRRSFLSRASATGVATTAAAVTTSIAAEGVNAQAVDASETRPIPGAIPVALKVNGETHRVRIDPRATVPDPPRATLHLTRTKRACHHGHCAPPAPPVSGRPPH